MCKPHLHLPEVPATNRLMQCTSVGIVYDFCASAAEIYLRAAAVALPSLDGVANTGE